MDLNELRLHLDSKLEMHNEHLDMKMGMHNDILTEKLANINLQLSTIKEQTIKTNGRVNRLEEKVEKTEASSSLHVMQCPFKKDLEDYKVQMANDLFLFTVMRKYPRVSTIIISILILLLVSGGIDKIKSIFGW